MISAPHNDPAREARIRQHTKRVQANLADLGNRMDWDQPEQDTMDYLPEAVDGASSEAIDAIRHHVFRMAYDHSEYLDWPGRFVDALLTSVQPIRDGRFVQHWYETKRKRRGRNPEWQDEG